MKKKEPIVLVKMKRCMCPCHKSKQWQHAEGSISCCPYPHKQGKVMVQTKIYKYYDN